MATYNARSCKAENKHERFLDADREPQKMLQPIEGYQDKPVVLLEEAVEPIVRYCPDIHRRVFIALSNCKTPADGLDENKSAAIYLYTMEWEPKEQCLYHVLNSMLRSESRQNLKPWFSYLKLLLTALYELPSEKSVIWRGVKLDLSQQFEEKKNCVWWGFSSCTESLSVLQSDQFLGKDGPRTLFNIESNNGKKIRSHSSIDSEQEILLLPGTYFEVKTKSNVSKDGLHIVHLKEVEPPFRLIEPPSKNTIVESTSQVNKHDEQLSQNYQNEELKQLIAEFPRNGRIDLWREELTDCDIPIVVQQAIIRKRCSELYINENNVTEEGAKYLGKVLQSNTSLQKLYMRDNHISDEGASWIAEALHTNTTLVELNLENNGITDEGARFLAEALHINSTLEKLVLDYNFVGNNGVRYFTQALNRNTILMELDLCENEVTDEGINYLAELLQQNTTLTSLGLSKNPLTNSGIKILMNSLHNSLGLERLSIVCSAVTDECLKNIQKMLKMNKVLTHLYLPKNSFSKQQRCELEVMAEEKQNFQIMFCG